MAMDIDNSFIKIKSLYLWFAMSDLDQNAHVCSLSQPESVYVLKWSSPYRKQEVIATTEPNLSAHAVPKSAMIFG